MVPVISQTIKPGNAMAEFYIWLAKDDGSCQVNDNLSKTKLYGASSELQPDWKDMLVTASILKQ